MKKPKNYYCHKSQYIPSSLSISDNLEIVEKIGEGAFGQVYKVFDHNSSELRVIKRHKGEANQQFINKENQIMKQMADSEGFAKIKQFNSLTCKTTRTQISKTSAKSCKATNQGQNNFSKNNQQSQNSQLIMMQCLGQSLSKVIEKKRIACQLIQRLKRLHDKGYTHRDLKPDNILLGNQLSPHKIYLIDYGLVSKYRRQAITKARKMYDGMIGTAKFCSLASHYGLEQFPKDDLESLGYVLLFLIHGQLPWKIRDTNLTDEQKFEKIKIMKQKTSISQLVQGVNCIKKYFQFIRSIALNSSIDYDYLLQIFKTDSFETYCYQFCKLNCQQKSKRLTDVLLKGKENIQIIDESQVLLNKYQISNNLKK